MPADQTPSGVPVVVVGEGLNCLGMLRSLAGRGIEVHVVTTTRWCPAGLSRFAQVTQVPELDGRGLVDGLLALRRRLGRPAVLMLGSDLHVDVVNDHRNELAAAYLFTLPPADQLRVLANKASFQQFAQDHALPVPRTSIVRQRDELVAALRGLELPLVLKPADKLQVLNGRAERAVRADTREQAEAAGARMLAACGCVVVQEWIPGADADIYFALFVCDRESRVVAMFCGRKLVCDPPNVGSTGICVEAGEQAAAVADEAQRFIRAAAFRGIGSIEFKRDRRTGRLVIVEPTIGRPNWQEEIATQCGVNLPLQSYRTECGLPPLPPETVDRPQAWSASMFYRSPAGALPAGVRRRDGYLRLDDPLPGLHHYLVDELARRAWRRLGRLLHGGRGVPAAEPIVAPDAKP
jgi:D-aspartate ligase